MLFSRSSLLSYYYRVLSLVFSHQTCQPDPGCLDARCDRWRIGPGGIEGNDIMIIGVIQVSAGCWMPILQLTRYIL